MVDGTGLAASVPCNGGLWGIVRGVGTGLAASVLFSLDNLATVGANTGLSASVFLSLPTWPISLWVRVRPLGLTLPRLIDAGA